MAAAETNPSTPVDPSLRVVRIVIEGLFDQFTHDIPLNQTDRVTVLHGPNGVGKTKVMEMTAALLNSDYRHLFDHLPFQRFRVCFADGSERVIQSGPSGPTYPPVPQRPLGCLLIETQRLWSPEERDYSGHPVLSVGRAADALAKKLAAQMAEYGRQSQALDRSFPQRIVGKGKVAPLSIEALKTKLENLEQQQRGLQELGLLDPKELMPPDQSSLAALDDTERRALTLYVADTEKKLSVLSDFAEKLRLFLRVTPQFLRKQIFFNRHSGLVVRNDRREWLAPEMLSSGEQHQIVLNYRLLFESKPNTLVLIDEPELSLHVSWQKRLLPNLIAIAKLSQIDIVVGTHSPFVIGDRADLMVALGGESEPEAV